MDFHDSVLFLLFVFEWVSFVTSGCCCRVVVVLFVNYGLKIRIILENTFPELKKNKYPMSHAELQNILIREKKEVSFIHGDSTIREEYTFTNNSLENKKIKEEYKRK